MRRIAVAECELLDGGSVEDAGRHAAPFPPRPALPAVGAFAAGLWGGCAAALSFAFGLDAGACLVGAAVVMVGALAALVFAWRAHAGVLAWLLIAGLCLGAGAGLLQGARLHDAARHIDQMHGRLSVTALSDGSTGDFGISCFAKVVDERGIELKALVSFPDKVDVPAYGERFEGYGSVSTPGDSSQARCWQRGAVASVKLRTCEKVERRDVVGVLGAYRRKAIGALTSPDRGDCGLAAALTCGWRNAMPQDAYRDFQVAGLAHLVAVSGAHLSIVAAFLAAAGRALRLPRSALVAVQVALLLVYLVLTAVPISAVRACAMTVAGMLSWTARRRASSLAGLSCCVVGVIVLDPQAALSVSFALSALSTLGIVVFGRLACAWVVGVCPGCPAFARDAIALSAASSIVGTPLSVALFSQLPIVSPLANVLVAPLFGPVCTTALVCACLGLFVPGASVLPGIACVGAKCLVAVVRACAAIPFASIPATLGLPWALLMSFGLAAGLWAWWPRPSRRAVAGAGLSAACCAFVAVVFAVFAKPTATEIVALDVGQGDAILVRSKGSAMLVDTGNQDGKLREALARQGVVKLDALLITHPDDDHMGSLASLRGVVQVDRVLVADGALACGCSACCKLVRESGELAGPDAVLGIRTGDRFTLGSWSCTCVWPRVFSDEGGNADSVCLTVDADLDADGQRDWRALLVGDAEHDELASMIAAGDVGHVDLYKIGHHGSKNALTQDEASTLSPSVSLCSVGANNRYGHPAPSTVEALEAAGSAVVRTDEHGDVVCRFTEERISVETLR